MPATAPAGRVILLCFAAACNFFQRSSWANGPIETITRSLPCFSAATPYCANASWPAASTTTSAFRQTIAAPYNIRLRIKSLR
jgi:hypothetical protein